MALLAAEKAPPTPERASVSIPPDLQVSAVLTGVDQTHERQRPEVSIGLTRAGQAEQELALKFTPEKYPQLKDVIEASFFWDIAASTVKLGDKQVARISLYGRTGEDLMVVDEIAILVDLDDTPRVLWLGLGDRGTNQFDVCVVDTKSTFSLTKDGLLERRTRSKKHVAKVDPEDEGMAHYVRNCKAPKRTVETFSLDVTPAPTSK